MRQQKKLSNKELVDKLLAGTAGEKYQGKQVVVINGQAHILPEDDAEAVGMVEKLENKHPGQIPHLVSVPRPETYIL